MIPKRIFQTWKEKDIKNQVLKAWQKSWTDCNPSYEYLLWDDNDNRKFIKNNFPTFLSIYDNYDVNIKRVDAVRYFYLLKYGGIYADLDFICLKPFDEVVKIDADVILGQLGEMDNMSNIYHSIPNAIMIAKENSDFFRFVTQVLHTIGNHPKLTPELATGPILLKFCVLYYINRNGVEEAIKMYGKNIFENCTVNFNSVIGLSEPDIFYPINWDNKNHSKYREKLSSNDELKSLFPNSYAVTYWMHSW
uniref:Glycosyltransferase n=1 Tax=viral metagenome TaxID=1070528 RepID=A0A6C0KR11_9ZZZZ